MTEAGRTLRNVVPPGDMGGGIGPKILPQLKGPAFTGAFKDKGPFSRIPEDVQGNVILNDHTPVLGAARHDGVLLRGLPLAGDKARKDHR